MRNPDGTLNGDLGDNVSATTTASVQSPLRSTVDENQTVYDLLPVIINKPPTILKSIAESSVPQIKPYSTADASGANLYEFPDGSIKVMVGASFRLGITAGQPNILNVENGVPVIKPQSTGLTYTWRKDGELLNSYNIRSMQSSVNVAGRFIEFVKIQPEHTGVYTCDITNDIGTTTSEPVNIEVITIDFDAYFMRNLVVNPYGKEGTDGWDSINADFTTKEFTQATTKELTTPYRVDLFGYNSDTLNPRPYQIDTGMIKEFDMTTALLNRGTYFTREGFKYDLRGGSTLVRAYQDIDVSEIQPLIKGSVFGLEGVRAMFSCYIGNALSYYVPVENILDPSRRLKPSHYILSKPRLSVENFLNSGPAGVPTERIYVTIEEYDNETRLSSRLLEDGAIRTMNSRVSLLDPWHKRIPKYWNKIYYAEDEYKIGDLSKGDGNDLSLFVADELFPKISNRFTYGQYAEFNKVVFDRLNPRTTKIRITINIDASADGRLFETYRDKVEKYEQPFEFLSYQQAYKRHSWQLAGDGNWQNSIAARISKLPTSQDKSEDEYMPKINEPRGMVTALNLTLLPIFTQNKSFTTLITNTTLVKNETPESKFTSGVTEGGRGYDPSNLYANKLLVDFKFKVSDEIVYDYVKKQYVQEGCLLELGFIKISNNIKTRHGITSQSLYPFGYGSPIGIETTTQPLQKPGQNDDPEMAAERNVLNGYLYEKLVERPKILNSPLGSSFGITNPIGNVALVNQANISSSATELSKVGSWSVQEYTRTTLGENETGGSWRGACMFQLNFYLTGSQGQPTQITRQIGGSDATSPLPLQSYFLRIDFEDGKKSTVTLFRDDKLYPGNGTVSISLEHYINARGELVCKIPNKLITDFTSNGGMQYQATGSIGNFKPTVNGSPTDLIESARNTFLSSSLVSITFNRDYQDVINQILKPISDRINVDNSSVQAQAQFDLFSFGSPPPPPPPPNEFDVFFDDIDTNDLIMYSQSLNAYAFGYSSQVSMSQALTDLDFSLAASSSYTLDFSKFRPRMENLTAEFTQAAGESFINFQTEYPEDLENIFNSGLTKDVKPSLYAVKPVSPQSAYANGVGTPSFGLDMETGEAYVIKYNVIRDEYLGSYPPIDPPEI